MIYFEHTHLQFFYIKRLFSHFIKEFFIIICYYRRNVRREINLFEK